MPTANSMGTLAQAESTLDKFHLANGFLKQEAIANRVQLKFGFFLVLFRMSLIATGVGFIAGPGLAQMLST